MTRAMRSYCSSVCQHAAHSVCASWSQAGGLVEACGEVGGGRTLVSSENCNQAIMRDRCCVCCV